MKKEKIKVSWALGVSAEKQIDFGLFPAHEKNQIVVDKDFWKKYVDARFQYEIMHKELYDKIS